MGAVGAAKEVKFKTAKGILAAWVSLSFAPGICFAVEPEIRLQWKLNKGQKLHCSLEQETNVITRTSAKVTRDSLMTLRVTTVWEVTKVNAGGKVEIRRKIQRIRFHHEAPGITADFDSKDLEATKGDFGLMASKMFLPLVESEIGFCLDIRGEVTDIKVPESLLVQLRAVPGSDKVGGLFSLETWTKVPEAMPPLPNDGIRRDQVWTGYNTTPHLLGYRRFRAGLPPHGLFVPQGILHGAHSFTYRGAETKPDRASQRFDISSASSFEKRALDEVPPLDFTVKSEDGAGRAYFDAGVGRLVHGTFVQKMTLEYTAPLVMERTVETKTVIKVDEVRKEGGGNREARSSSPEPKPGSAVKPDVSNPPGKE